MFAVFIHDYAIGRFHIHRGEVDLYHAVAVTVLNGAHTEFHAEGARDAVDLIKAFGNLVKRFIVLSKNFVVRHGYPLSPYSLKIE